MANTKPANKSYGIRTNVILGFTFAFLAVVAAGYFTYQSTTKLLDSVLELSRPDQKLGKLREVLSDLTEAENNMRLYALLKDEDYFNNYLDNIYRADKNIDTLKIITADNEEHQRKVRQISVLLNTRLRNIDDFMVFRQATDTFNYARRALDILKASPYDTTRMSIYTRMSTTTSLIDTIRIEPIVEEKPAPSRGLFSRLTGVFSSREDKKVQPEPEIPEQVIQETVIVRDTNILVQADTVLYYHIQDVLLALREEEAQLQQKRFEKELELLRSNSVIISQILDVISGLEKDEVILLNVQTTKAREVAGHSVMIISAIMLSSLFMILMFLFLIMRAISRSNYLRNQLIIAKQKAEHLAQVKEEFLATMSHEIRTPLNSILGFSEQLSRTKLDVDQMEQLDAVKLSSEHLLSLVNDILDFSKIEQGRLRLEKVPFTVKNVMEETYRTFSVKAKEKGVKLGYYIECDEEVILKGDPLRLKQVLFNLVGNAVKFTQKGKVFIVCKRVSQQLAGENTVRIRFEVHDTGIGITPHKLDAIFEGFTQADSSLSRKFGGTGLGLTISKRLIEMQNGTIGVASEEGKGSVFHFEIPYEIAEREELAKRDEALQFDSLLLQGKFILVVDDDIFNIRLTTMILERWGMKVDYAMSGKDALDMIKRNDYDVILTDIHMPDMNGIDLSLSIRTITDVTKASIPIIAITANIMKDDLDHYMKSGMDDYVLKPYRESELFSKIAGQLGFDDVRPQSPAVPKFDEPIANPGDFDLKDVMTFTGGNKKSMAVILDSFLHENTQNLEALEQSFEEGDYKTIAALAHKMLTSYGHLGVQDIKDVLERLEKINLQSDQTEVKELISEVQRKSAGIFPAIQKKVMELNG